MTTRAQAAENALASVRAEGLDPGVAEALLRRWARGELSDAQLDDAARQISTRELRA
jgi:antitoxin VbhA-like protein